MASENEGCAVGRAISDMVRQYDGGRYGGSGDEARFVKLEAETQSLRSMIEETSKSVAQLASAVSEKDKALHVRITEENRITQEYFTKEIGNLGTKIENANEKRQITWPFLITIGSFLLVAGATASALIMLTLRPIDASIAQLTDITATHTIEMKETLIQQARHDEMIKQAKIDRHTLSQRLTWLESKAIEYIEDSAVNTHAVKENSQALGELMKSNIERLEHARELLINKYAHPEGEG